MSYVSCECVMSYMIYECVMSYMICECVMSFMICVLYTTNESCDRSYIYNTTVMWAAEDDKEEASSKCVCEIYTIHDK